MTDDAAVKNQIVKQDDHSLTQYGDTAAINALGKRIRLMMPGGQNYTINEALMLAQLCIAHNLNPFNGEAWMIKNKKTGEVLGAIIGIKGLRKQAKRQCDYWGAGDNGGFRHITDQEELKKYNSSPADTVYEYTLGDDVTQKRWIEGLTALREAKYDQNDAREMMGPMPVTRGIGVYKSNEPSKMKPNQCAMFRAEKDALKRRFDVDFLLPLPTMDGEVLSRDPEVAGMTAADFDEAMGIEKMDERNRLPPMSDDKPKGNMMGFDPDEISNGSVDVLDLEFEDDAELPSEPAPETQPKPKVKKLDPEKYQPVEEKAKVRAEQAAETDEIIENLNGFVQDVSSFSQDIKANGTPREPEPETEPEPKKGKLPPNPLKGKVKPTINKDRPYSPSGLSEVVEKWVEKFDKPCSDKHREYLGRTMLTMFDGDANAVERVCEHLTGQPGAFSMEDGYVQALLQAWMDISDWKGVPSNVSIVEGKALNNHLRGSVDQDSFDLGETEVEE